MLDIARELILFEPVSLQTVPTEVDQSLISTQLNLFEACYTNNIQSLEVILNEHPDILEADFMGITPFTFACYIGQVEVVQHLLESHSTLRDTRNSKGFSPLEMACFGGRPEIVKLLFEKGVRLPPLSNEKDAISCILFGTAVYGLDLDAPARAEESATCLRLILEKLTDADLKTHRYRIPSSDPSDPIVSSYIPLLLVAYYCGSWPCMRMLIDRLDISERDQEGNTILHHAIKVSLRKQEKFQNLLDFCSKSENPSILELLNQKNNQGKTPLDLARERGQQEKVDLLLQYQKAQGIG